MEDGDLKSHGHGTFDDMLGLALIRKYRGDGPDAVVAGSLLVVEEDLSGLLGLIPSDICERNS